MGGVWCVARAKRLGRRVRSYAGRAMGCSEQVAGTRGEDRGF